MTSINLPALVVMMLAAAGIVLAIRRSRGQQRPDDERARATPGVRVPKVRIVIVGLLAIYVIGGLAGGCNAYRRPASLNADERSRLHAPPLPYTVTIKSQMARATSQNPGAYARALERALTGSAAFRASRLAVSTGSPEGDIIATPTGTYCNVAIIPAATGLSLGIIPTIFDDADCVGLELQRPGVAANSGPVRIEFRNETKAVMGWAAVAVGLLPGWSHGSPQNDSRFHQRFRLAVIDHQAEIESLLRR